MIKNVTTLIPVYNTKPEALLEAVHSMLKQSIGEVPILIVDDASTDKGTLKMLDYLRSYGGVFVHKMEVNGGTSKALNAGHERINSEYVAIMGSDDVSHPDRLKLQMDFLLKNPKIDVLGTNLFSFYDHDITRKQIFISKHPNKPTLKDSSYGWLVNHGTAIYKVKAANDVGGYKLPGRAQDVDLWKRMAQAGKQFANIPEILYAWRRYSK